MRPSIRTIPRTVTFLTGSLLSLLLAPGAYAWSNKEHIQLTRIAAERLIANPEIPPSMKDWLRKGIGQPLTMEQERDYFLHKRVGVFPRDVDGLPYWATVPDLAAGFSSQDKVAPWGVPERLLHYIDVEYFMPDASKRAYAHDLSHMPALGDFPDDPDDPRYKQAGMLPFRVRETYGKLVESIREGRLNDQPGQFPRDDHAAKWGGMLAHYAQDNTQPHHATIDYKSQSYFGGRRTAPNVHAEVEYRMCDDEYGDFMDLRREFWPLFVEALEKVKDPATTGDPWRSTLEVSLASYDALPLIGEAAAAAGQGNAADNPDGRARRLDTETFFRHRGKVGDREMTVMEMKALQTALAVRRVERLWVQAWREAQREPQHEAGAARQAARPPP